MGFFVVYSVFISYLCRRKLKSSIMAHSSPEGIILGKGSKLVSFDASINGQKVVSLQTESKEDKIKRLEKELEEFKNSYL